MIGVRVIGGPLFGGVLGPPVVGLTGRGAVDLVDPPHLARHLVTGDLVAHEAQVADPELVFVNDMDPDQAAVTRRRVLAELADEGADVIAGHFVGIGRIERAGTGFRWAVE